MFKKMIFAMAAAATMSFAVATSANAWSLGSAARPLGHRSAGTNAPLQFQVFCLMNPAECRSSRVSSVAYKGHMADLLQRVNDEVNHQITYRADAKGHNVWQIAAKYGNCDDYVMTKRHRLIKAGFPASALRVAVVRTSWGEGHAVLLAETSSGEYVLDNIRKTIVRRGASGYNYLSVSGANPMHWHG